MSTEPIKDQSDPLGLDVLEQRIEAAQKDPAAIAAVTVAFAHTQERYTAMKDRYRLLKASSRQLAEEVAWLRDQCDDFMMEQGGAAEEPS